MLTVRRPIIGIERHRPARARQRLVIRRQEVPLAERRRQLAQFVSMDQMPCRHKHPQGCDALCVAIGDATHPATRLEFRH